ncbi:golgin subfamily A member 6-like protein 2 [Cardiocondyla obscurior]|uniref:golgin subfamily A member 6-like protein 2 n=1 Tax=Cardiocondyla obscurior TaxID=286306 RepID=UPI0039656583
MEEGRGSGLARKCWEEIKEREEKGKAESGWERERRSFYEEKERIRNSIERGETLGETTDWISEMERRDKEEQRREREERIEKSNYNKWYKRVKAQGVPEYLKKGWKEKRWRRVTRFRLGEEMRGNKYWEKEERKKCRVCGMVEMFGSMFGKNVEAGEWRGHGGIGRKGC